VSVDEQPDEVLELVPALPWAGPGGEFVRRASGAYIPRSYAGPVQLILTADVLERRGPADAGGGWQTVVAQLRIRGIDTSHLGMVMPESLPTLANEIRACLASASRGSSAAPS